MHPLLQLGGNVGIADNGPGNELGEHGHIGRKVDEAPLGRGSAPVNINDITENLKRIEADADGQRHMEQRHGQPGETVEAGKKKIGVFAIAKQTEADDGGATDAQPRPLPFRPILFRQQAEYIALHDGDDHEHHEPRLAPCVEQQACQQQNGVFQPVRR